MADIKMDELLKTKHIYDKIASQYAEAWFQITNVESSIDIFIECVNIPGDILDVGCGPGRDVLSLTQRGFNTVGIDISNSMIKEARLRAPHNIFRKMDMRRMTYPSELFAGLWVCASFQHLPLKDTIKTMTEFSRILKPGGTISLVVEEGEGEYHDPLGRYHKLYMTDELNNLFQKTGFHIKRIDLSSSTDQILKNNTTKKWIQVIAKKDSLLENGHNDCIFCSKNRFQLERQNGMVSSGSVLWGDKNIYVSPDIAPLTEGHLLIISSPHFICFGETSAEFNHSIGDAENFINQLLWKLYKKPVFYFEHGPSQYDETGSCIDHAHLHCIPISLKMQEDICHYIEKFIGQGKEASIDVLRNYYQKGKSYLYVKKSGAEGKVYRDDFIPSQFLRKVVGSHLGQRNWIWNENFQSEESKQIHNRMLDKMIPLTDRLLSSDNK